MSPSAILMAVLVMVRLVGKMVLRRPGLRDWTRDWRYMIVCDMLSGVRVVFQQVAVKSLAEKEVDLPRQVALAWSFA